MPQITKSAMENMGREVGVLPVARQTLDGAEIFVSDGAVSATDVVRLDWKFPGTSESFPGGCYMTVWFTSCREDKLDAGQPLFFELFHNPELSHRAKRSARINAAVNAAKEFLDRRKKARH